MAIQALADGDILYHMNRESRVFKEKFNGEVKNAHNLGTPFSWLKGGWWVKMTDIIANIPGKKLWDDVSEKEIFEVDADYFMRFIFFVISAVFHQCLWTLYEAKVAEERWGRFIPDPQPPFSPRNVRPRHGY